MPVPWRAAGDFSGPQGLQEFLRGPKTYRAGPREERLGLREAVRGYNPDCEWPRGIVVVEDFVDGVVGFEGPHGSAPVLDLDEHRQASALRDEVYATITLTIDSEDLGVCVLEELADFIDDGIVRGAVHDALADVLA